MTKAILRTHIPLHHQSARVHPSIPNRKGLNGDDQVLEQEPSSSPSPERAGGPVQIHGLAQYIECELPDTLSTRFTSEAVGSHPQERQI